MTDPVVTPPVPGSPSIPVHPVWPAAAPVVKPVVPVATAPVAPPTVLSYPSFREWLAAHFASVVNHGSINAAYILNTLDQLIQREEAVLAGKPDPLHPTPRPTDPVTGKPIPVTTPTPA